MKKLLGPYSDFFFLLLRVVAALMFMSHGLQKLNVHMLGGFTPPPELPQLTAAAWIETIGAVLIILGLGSRYVAFILSGEMAVAYFMSHAGTVMGPIQATAGTWAAQLLPASERRRDHRALLLPVVVSGRTRAGEVQPRREAGIGIVPSG